MWVSCTLFVWCVKPFIHTAVCDDEYIIDLNTNLITSDAEQADFAKKIETDFSLTFEQNLNVGSLRMLLMSTNNALDVASLSALNEVNSVEENGEVQDEGVDTRFCHERAAPETWGLDRIDQREKLASSDPLNILAKYTVGPYRGK